MHIGRYLLDKPEDGQYILFVPTHAFALSVKGAERHFNDGSGWVTFDANALESRNIRMFTQESRKLYPATAGGKRKRKH